MLSLKKCIIGGLLCVLSLSVVLVVGCDRVTRYKILTFFFEGVPPLDAPQDELLTPVLSDTTDTDIVPDYLSPRIARQRIPSRHPPTKNCTQCHLKGPRWHRTQMYKPVPDLCYSCHTHYNVSQGLLHGPVAVGACLFCHKPHDSKYMNLQTAPQPELCFQCHTQEDIASIVDHQDMLETICTTCHDPHISTQPKLLKPYRDTTKEPNSIDLN